MVALNRGMGEGFQGGDGGGWINGGRGNEGGRGSVRDFERESILATRISWPWDAAVYVCVCVYACVCACACMCVA